MPRKTKTQEPRPDGFMQVYGQYGTNVYRTPGGAGHRTLTEFHLRVCTVYCLKPYCWVRTRTQ